MCSMELAKLYRLTRRMGYMGCGSGIITVDREADKCLSMEYTDFETDDKGGLIILEEQNGPSTRDDAGTIIHQDEDIIVYIANFSRWQASLTNKIKHKVIKK